MSRGSAVAYDLPAIMPDAGDALDRWPGRGDSSAYKLLGDFGTSFGGPVPLVLDDEQIEPLSTQPSYIEQAYALASDYYAPAESHKVGLGGIVSPKLLISLLVAVLLAIGFMLVTPVLAMVATAGAHGGLSISRYSDASAGAQSNIIGGADIDVTAGGSQPAQPVAPAPASTQPGNYDLVAAPSISVQQIESVLGKYGSPAEGQGQALYDLGVKYGIDPAYALAFFVHESACGTRGVARFTHSLGNIRWTDGYDNYQGYRSYGTWAQGMEDWYKLITDLYINGWGLRTVGQIIPVYAPTGDGNDPTSYISSVEFLVDSWRGK